MLLLEERYNEFIDETLATNFGARVEFEPTPERLDDQFFTVGSTWRQISDAEDMSETLDFLELAGYSRDLEGYIQANEYVPQYFSWTDVDQNELNLIRSICVGMHDSPFIRKAYYYEQNGDIIRIY